MHKITKGLKKKKKGKKSKKNKDDDLFKPEELEAYRRDHQLQQLPHEDGENSESAAAAGAVDNEEWKKFNALTAGIDNILKKTQAQIRPSLEYCSHIWSSAPKHTLALLDSIQKRAIRLINDEILQAQGVRFVVTFTTDVLMSKPPGRASSLSTRGGTLVLKSISLFLTSGRNAARSESQEASRPKTKRKKMPDKDGKNKISVKLLEAVKRDTHFTRSEIEGLYKVYRKLITMNRPKTNQDNSGASGSNAIIGKRTIVEEGIDRTVFRELLHSTFDIVTEDMMMDRIFCVWDKLNAGLLTPEAWFWGLSIFLRGTIAEQTDFCFAVYDLNGDGFIAKDEMFQLLKNCLIKQPQEEDPDEGVKDLIEIVLKKLDKDKDGKVSLTDYRQSVEEEPLLLQAFGTCLPNERARDTFIITMRGDLDRIKSTSFFKRVPPPSEVKKREQEQELKRAPVEEEPKQLSVTEAAIVLVSESESEDEEDDIFDTTYIDVIAAGEVKLAYIPESPTDQPEGDDPFDTSIAERAILGPSVERKGKKLVPIGAAVEILTGRVQAPTCVPTKRPTPRRQILKEKDLLLGSFDDNANSVSGATREAPPPVNRPSLLDDDAPSALAGEPIDLSRSLHQSRTPVSEVRQEPKEARVLNEFEGIVANGSADVDDEFALLAAESLSKKSAVNTVPPVITTTTTPQISKQSWNAFGEEKPAEINVVGESDGYGDDPFDTTFAENILPGKAELKIIENEILNAEDDDLDFNPRAEEVRSTFVQHKVSIQLTNPTGQRESISSLDRVSESELNFIQPSHRDLLGGSNTDLSQLEDKPLEPNESIDETYIEYCDPFDTSIVESVKLPGHTELKFLERELLSDLKTDAQAPESEDDFDPRAEEPARDEAPTFPQNRKVSFELPLNRQSSLLGSGLDCKVSKPLTPYYVRDNSIPEIEDAADPFDTSFVPSTAPGKIELKVIESELFDPALDDVTDRQFDPRDDKQVAVAKVVQTIREINEPTAAKFSGLFDQPEPVDLLTAGDHVAAKVLTPAAETGNCDQLSYADPFDTSIACNILPGKTELKLLESELIHSDTIRRNLTDPEFDPRSARPEAPPVKRDFVGAKPLTPVVGHKVSFDVGGEDDDLDPFDTSIANNIGPGRAELKLLESQLI